MGSEGTDRLGGPPVTAIVLAGGKSSRFGADKAAALLLGRPLLQWVMDAAAEVADDVIVVAAVGKEVPGITCAVPARLVRDQYEARGPLAGLVTGFDGAKNDVCLVLSCDAPLVQPALLSEMARGLAGAARLARIDGRLQPLPGAYRRSACQAAFREAVGAGRLSLTAAVEALAPEVVEEDAVRLVDPGLRSFSSANTVEELRRIAEVVRG